MKVDVYSYEKTEEKKVETRRYLDEAIEHYSRGKTEAQKDQEFEKARREIVKTGRYWLEADILLMRAQ